jgi:hypothetical protein
MYPSEVMGNQRIADRIREAQLERRSRPIAEARAASRRARVRAVVVAMWAGHGIRNRQRVAQPAAGR